MFSDCTAATFFHKMNTERFITSLFLFIVPCIVSRDILSVSPPSITYDQRQTGKYNIHLNIKDVSIIALEADGLAGSVGVCIKI